MCLYSLNTEKTAAPANCAVVVCNYSLIDQCVPSSTREDTVLANAPTKKVNEQDTNIPKCYVGRNGK